MWLTTLAYPTPPLPNRTSFKNTHTHTHTKYLHPIQCCIICSAVLQCSLVCYTTSPEGLPGLAWPWAHNPPHQLGVGDPCHLTEPCAPSHGVIGDTLLNLLPLRMAVMICYIMASTLPGRGVSGVAVCESFYYFRALIRDLVFGSHCAAIVFHHPLCCNSLISVWHKFAH